ncbi:Yip1 family protein [Leptospira borgpetersenii]|uniref:Yip1 family protein n=1 Tax=Leptospira borgpetersenii TaxID=174 RepID=UPI0007742736|nr:Yip1 family protein [Leptospira borgpetersenii]MBE8400245.1 YIP1 family protein [Leptospira borgpetersenii serovar Tarassovi]MBE8402412.1 YIP1 family protein [Leptospira borgpetersenii serovar Tarassovi]MBE8405333.1 YIP1 family protein [Leptospira borgpetersenii serovar Tarassovi]MBE8412745.1 YIP1 family protein [Leptospira borgpetersenii serovar Tarassovi]MBE8415812.1 YIP1 family protein [Leptospira borgpetersenii serovar Tarassovi]
MHKFSFSFMNVIEEAGEVLIKPVSFFKDLSKAPEESLISLYLRCLIYMSFLYAVAVISMTLLAPNGFPSPSLIFLFFEMPTAYLLASFLIFPILGFLYMFFSWICGGNTGWKKNFRAGTASLSVFWAILLLQSFGGLIHIYLGMWIGIAFTAYVPFLSFLALTSYLKAPVKRTAIVLSLFMIVLLYLQYSRMNSYMKDHKIIENVNSQKSTTIEKEKQEERETMEIIRKAMEKAKAEEQR